MIGGRSLRWRVTVSVLALVVTTLIVLSIAVDVALAKRLRSDIRSRLTARAAVAVQVERRVTAQALADRLSGDGVTATVTDAAGTVVTGRPNVKAPLPRLARRLGIRIAPIVQEGDTLTVAQPLTGGRTLMLQAGLGEITRALKRLRAVEIAVSTTLIALVGLVMSAISRAALAPLDRMTAMARSITGGDRGARLTPEHPDTEIGRAASAIDEMLDALEASETRMRAFLDDASHELRTPIASLQASAETLLHASLSRQEREQLAVDMVREGQRASRLVDDLLALARLDQGGPTNAMKPDRDIEDVDLVAAAQEAIAILHRAHPNKAVHTNQTGASIVPTNRNETIRVIVNLLKNATAASSDDTPLELLIDRTEVATRLQIGDHGLGVPEADRERIFERFVRLDPARARDGGASGLGLAITRSLLAQWGGTVSCESRTDGAPGARFVVTIPNARRCAL